MVFLAAGLHSYMLVFTQSTHARWLQRESSLALAGTDSRWSSCLDYILVAGRTTDGSSRAICAFHYRKQPPEIRVYTLLFSSKANCGPAHTILPYSRDAKLEKGQTARWDLLLSTPNLMLRSPRRRGRAANLRRNMRHFAKNSSRARALTAVEDITKNASTKTNTHPTS